MKQHLQFCVYKITNTISGKSYIGKTCNLENRWKGHLRGSKSNKLNSKFPNALRKYPKDTWNISILYETDNEDHCYEVEALLVDEYDTFHNGYNSCGGGKGAGSGENNPNYGKTFIRSKETRKRLSIANTGKKQSEETRKKKSIANTGLVRSEETRKKMSIVQSGENNPMFNKTVSSETRKKLSVANTGKNRSEETRKKLSSKNNPMFGKQPWETPKCKSKGLKINWFYLDKVYDLRTKYNMGGTKIYKILVKDYPDIKKSPTSFQNMFRWIEKNGNPTENKDWMDFHDKF